MVVAQHCECTNCHWIVYLKMVSFGLYEGRRAFPRGSEHRDRISTAPFHRGVSRGSGRVLGLPGAQGPRPVFSIPPAVAVGRGFPLSPSGQRSGKVWGSVGNLSN